jgi:cyclase
MSKLRLIPKLQLKPASFNPNKLVLVITKQFNQCIEIGDPVSQAKIFQDQASDELIFVNIDENRNHAVLELSKVINKLSQEIFMPLTVGGGVARIEDFRLLLSNGADKISINTHALESPELINNSADKFGTQCVVVGIDYKKDEEGNYFVYSHRGRVKTSYHPVEWAEKAVSLGAGEILLTSIERDGMRCGLEIDLTKQVVEAVGVPVITSGGCGLASHFSDGFLLGGVNAVSAGSFFAHRDQNFMQTRSHILNAGVNIRKHQ